MYIRSTDRTMRTIRQGLVATDRSRLEARHTKSDCNRVPNQIETLPSRHRGVEETIRT